MRTTQFMGLTIQAEYIIAMECKHYEFIPDYTAKLNKAFEEFKTQYRATTSADWQTFILGFRAAAKELTGRNIPVSKDLKPVEGMFDEVVHTLKEYEMNDGTKIEEYIQAEPWSSGPCIYLALKNAETKEPILDSLWSEDEIHNA